jgi:GNAT superfamily N-acetyltransferase
MKTEYPLTKANRLRLARAFRNVPRVDISIECVLEGQMGKAFADDLDNPSAFQIQAGSFHYFAGDVFGNGGQEILREFKPYNLFMSSTEGWLDEARRVYGERFVGIDRYCFSSERLSLKHIQMFCRDHNSSFEIKRFDSHLMDRTWGKDHFVDVSDFESPADFLERGIGYYAEKDGRIIGAAYSSLVCNAGIEISLFVAEEHRRQGVATLLSAHLLQWCLQNNMDAHWDAANPASCKLAEKLGYIPCGSYKAYYLSM